MTPKTFRMKNFVRAVLLLPFIGRDADIDEGVRDHLPQDRILEVGREILQPDKDAGLRHRAILQAEKNAVTKRIPDKMPPETGSAAPSSAS